MTAPGNTVILLVLLSAFAGCVGYAVGRWHERRASGDEREEAYRDGYDQAARRAFSLAARVAGRRRRGAVRASAAVSRSGEPASAAPAPEPTAPLGPIPVPGTPAPAPAPSAGAPFPAPEPAPAPSAGAPFPAPATPAAPAPLAPSISAAAPDPVPMPGRRRAAAAGPPETPVVGFPAPAPHVVPGIPGPQAVGGVHYSSLPDPQWSGIAEAEPTAEVPPPRRHATSPEGGGRHGVPEELVRAATYKLTADRVARAKVHDPSTPAPPPEPSFPTSPPASSTSPTPPSSASPPSPPPEPRRRPPVPRPRGL
ncbi:hypothetical protein BJY16_000087 [Actinoplanes octamycinicus]|uniref:Uncharacterized protein n=1 Tax=Actinoplanes octamycinicus TaxID=135948 RepID=A0A7W7GQW2_9ACTN|nr:hypothetical protein [Actinoplanes octamycinicus]MBB4736628.1 hypothetical protein [Actinoplanes octamycinicus]GIE63166.1 hypothetical protein Aoc01nite_85680 [Actinoplanes octamycinicus]